MQSSINKTYSEGDRMIDIYLLEYLIAFYEEGSLLKASEKLHISQPSLSRSMQKIEFELGISIFNRTKNKLELNENGLVIVEYAKNIVALEKLMLEKAKEIKNRNLTLRIGLTAPGPIYKFQHLFSPSSQIKVTTSIQSEQSLINDIKNGLLDLAFINTKIEDVNLVCRHVMVEHLYMWIPKTHFLSKLTNGIYFKDADGQSFLLAENLGIWEDITRKMLPNSKLYIQNINNLLDIVTASTIPAFLTNATNNLRNDDNRVAIPFLDKEAYMNFYVICKKENKNLLNNLNK